MNLSSMAHEKSPFLDSASDENINSLTREATMGGAQLYTRLRVVSVLLAIRLGTIIAAPQT